MTAALNLDNLLGLRPHERLPARGNLVRAGVYRISNEAYHSGPGISKSGLDRIDQSPLHYWARHLDPDRAPDKETPTLLVGRALHCLALEPEVFSKEFVQAPDFDRRTKKGKEAEAEFLAAHQGLSLLTAAQMGRVNRMAEALHGHPTASTLLTGGLREHSLYWRDEETDVLCRVRPDYLRADAIVDLKTTASASMKDFSKSVANYRYHVQNGFYNEGVRRVLGSTPDTFIFIAVESDAPYAVNCFVLDEDARRQGRLEFRDNLRTYAECLRNDRWPGYGAGITQLSLPGWYTRSRDGGDATVYEWEEPTPEVAHDHCEFHLEL